MARKQESVCVGCALAQWRTTGSGRLHPSGDGRCLWRFETVALPLAFNWFGGRVPSPSGGYINRREKVGATCPQRAATAIVK